jgi:glycosyltransferase involved in cell wall biosynthesis
MLIRYFHAGRFAGKDQSVMLSAYLENPSLGVIVKPSLHDIDWFFLEYLLSEMQVPYILDDSYQSAAVAVAVAISILIPIHNGVEYLEECIRSVLAQTYTNYEVIIAVNGHGADGGIVGNTAKQLAKLDSRIRVIIQGPPIASKVESLNDIMRHARAEWICLLDCDDTWLPTKLEEQIAAKQSVACDAAVIGTFCAYFGSYTGSPHRPGGYIDSGVLATVNPIVNSSSMIHRSFCEWRNEYELEDYDLWMRIALAGGRMYNIPKVLTRHRIHTGSAFNSRQLDPTPLRQRFQAMYSR